MTSGHPWAVPNTTRKYGGAFLTAPKTTSTHMGASDVAGPALATNRPVWSPEHPLFWFGSIAAVSFGLMAFSTTVRVGHARVSTAVGTT